MVPKAAVAVVDKIKIYILIFLLIIFTGSSLIAQDIPEDELQARINTYFDNFGVIVVYPSINYSKNFPKTQASQLHILLILSAQHQCRACLKLMVSHQLQTTP
ncbi:MAG: hypothetical protein R3A12_15315 [Ignavibacteria bacterium]